MVTVERMDIMICLLVQSRAALKMPMCAGISLNFCGYYGEIRDFIGDSVVIILSFAETHFERKNMPVFPN